jgi:hypothetical protein
MSTLGNAYSQTEPAKAFLVEPSKILRFSMLHHSYTRHCYAIQSALTLLHSFRQSSLGTLFSVFTTDITVSLPITRPAVVIAITTLPMLLLSRIATSRCLLPPPPPDFCPHAPTAHYYCCSVVRFISNMYTSIHCSHGPVIHLSTLMSHVISVPSLRSTGGVVIGSGNRERRYHMYFSFAHTWVINP